MIVWIEDVSDLLTFGSRVHSV